MHRTTTYVMLEVTPTSYTGGSGAFTLSSMLVASSTEAWWYRCLHKRSSDKPKGPYENNTQLPLASSESTNFSACSLLPKVGVGLKDVQQMKDSCHSCEYYQSSNLQTESCMLGLQRRQQPNPISRGYQPMAARRRGSSARAQ
ncbi:hypothetical protein Baya_12257 [Bagarius yarrelli]|uniref:Uncharacterized protein n=1 Tax=Bagarius yarrelli TaxID=175774 RepID=A0A556V4P3_BAGYA|nr:hypothetical protein Baya_12257 [Bagarius yarrelli]